jgi:prephenate dehydrogenase
VIYGVGLMGGSLGMAMRRRRMAETVVGLGRSRKTLERAVTLGALDESHTEAEPALKGADALILCLPPRLIRKRWSELAPLIAPGTFVTDVGSVKGAVVEEAESHLPSGVLFVGSHPMAGSEMAGVEAARGDLFDGASCFVTPTERTPMRALTLAVAFWRALDSRVAILNPERHDRLLAAISHLPHLAAVSLVQSLYAQGDSTLFYRSVIGNGFRDTTRIAAGDAQLWEQIFSENREALGENLGRWIEILTRWKELLSRGDSSGEIIESLSRAADQRRSLSSSTQAPPG